MEFCDVGSIIYIRRVNKIQEVAYYTVDAVSTTWPLNTEVRYIVTYIDGDGPGAGIPGVLSSAKVLDKIIKWQKKTI